LFSRLTGDVERQRDLRLHRQHQHPKTTRILSSSSDESPDCGHEHNQGNSYDDHSHTAWGVQLGRRRPQAALPAGWATSVGHPCGQATPETTMNLL
jgi:hypothetical protein